MAKKSRVLVYAPTNTAIGQLACHLVSLLEKSTQVESILDIILFGNNDERMKVKNDKDLSKVYWKYCVEQQRAEHFSNVSYSECEL
jgi:hypothetical protein